MQFDSYDDLPPKNAFVLLVASSKTRTLPTFNFLEELKSNDELKLEIISYMRSYDAGWTSEFMPSGKKFVRDLAEAFWYINKCGLQYQQISCSFLISMIL